MEYGEKITALRKKSGMTQAELGNELNVTYQAVSKWERGESLPDFATMSKIAKLFGVPLSYFEDDAEERVYANADDEEEKKMLGVCTECGRVVYEGEEDSVTPVVRCKECADRMRRAEAAKQKALAAKKEDERKKSEAATKAYKNNIRRKRNRGLIGGGIFAAVMTVMLIIAMFAEYKPGDGMTRGDVVLGYFIWILFGFPFVAQLFWGGAVRDICLTGGKLVGMPGVIFSLDLDGCFFLIGVKILFALIKGLIFILSLLFFVIVAFLIAPFTFVPRLIKLNLGKDDDI